MDAWLIWLIAAVALAVGELFTFTFVLALLGGAAALTGVLAALGLSPPLQLVVFGVAATSAVLLVRPVRRWLRPRHITQFGVDALVGSPGYVLVEVSDITGRVRIGGEEWTARAVDDVVVIPTGATVDVMRIDGSTAIVYPREGQCSSQLN